MFHKCNPLIAVLVCISIAPSVLADEPATVSQAGFHRLSKLSQTRTAATARVDAMWGYSIPRPTYKVLPRENWDEQYYPTTARPLFVGRPMQPYAYGWFGANSTVSPYRAHNLRESHNKWIFK